MLREQHLWRKRGCKWRASHRFESNIKRREGFKSMATRGNIDTMATITPERLLLGSTSSLKEAPKKNVKFRRARAFGSKMGKSRFSRWLRAMYAVFKDFCTNCSFHGLRFIVDDKLHWTERLFWMSCCLLSWYGSALLMLSSWDGFIHNAISFAMETNYLSWETEFPAITICEVKHLDVIQGFRPKHEGDEKENDYLLDEVYGELAFSVTEPVFTKSRCFQDIANAIFKDPLHCPRDKLWELPEKYTTPCKNLLFDCKWREKPFNCCDYFLPIETELGKCFIFNSIHTKINAPSIDTVSSKKKGLAHISGRIRQPVKVSTIARQEVPYANEKAEYVKEVKGGMIDKRLLEIKEVENDPAVEDTSIQQRGCRLENEGLRAYRKYTLNGCIVQCRMDAMMRICGCVYHPMPNARREDICDLKGLACLINNANKFWVMKQDDEEGNFLTCRHCPLSCEDQELRVVWELMESTNDSFGSFDIRVHRLPTVRFKRNVVRGKLDLVVSMGGTCGLLVGASLLSFVELFYFFAVRTQSYPTDSAPDNVTDVKAKILVSSEKVVASTDKTRPLSPRRSTYPIVTLL